MKLECYGILLNTSMQGPPQSPARRDRRGALESRGLADCELGLGHDLKWGLSGIQTGSRWISDGISVDLRVDLKRDLSGHGSKAGSQWISPEIPPSTIRT